jgi:hypothetical protein
MSRLSLLSLALCALTLSACTFKKSDHPAACRTDADCKDKGGGACSEGFCLTEEGRDASLPNKKDSGSSASKDDAGKAGEACEKGQPPIDCYDGPANTKDVGACRGGARICSDGTLSDCIAQTVPADEMCNAKDDDCDGKTDEITMGNCETQMNGICNAGALVCRGQYPVCEPIERPVDEKCNSEDDDCDGKTDEITSEISCYPPNKPGCKAEGGGVFTCVGLCQPGKLACNSGKGACAGATPPGTEACTEGTDLAADEDCDGKIDEGCACHTGDVRPCYSGPENTEGKGECKAGMQTCVDELWGGACENEVVSAPETCENPGEDNDCNETKDDVPMLGVPCINDEAFGICRPGTWQCAGKPEVQCVSNQEPQSERCDKVDQDCDGDPINGFDLNNDNNNCGECGKQCSPDAEMCCEAGCRNLKEFREDRKNCGSCGNECGSSEFCCQSKCVKVDLNGGVQLTDPNDSSLCQCEVECEKGQACCGKACVDLQNDSENCGACGHNCKGILGGSGRCANGTCPLL